MSDQLHFLNSFLDEWNGGAGITAYTSGSTGDPKRIILPMDKVVRSARRTNLFFGISKSSRLHSGVSFRYIGGKMMIARSLLAGCELTFSEPSLHLEVPRGDREVSLLTLVPAQMPHILEHKEKFSHVRRFLLGGSAIDDALWDAIAESGFDAYETYGMTETASHVALRRIVGPSYRRPRFAALNGVDLKVDPDGCLVITDGDDTVHTHDIAMLHNDATFTILGRSDDIIISGGVKILPQEVEGIIKPFVGRLCSDFFITSIPDTVWTAKLVLACVPADTAVRPGTLRHALDLIPTDILPKKMRPKEIVFIPSLPLTPSGKLLRRLPASDQ